MDILMIGNGFDIEHGLPTTYADFLQFVESFLETYTMVQIMPNIKSKIKDEYLKFIFESPETNADGTLYEYLKDNIWIEHRIGDLISIMLKDLNRLIGALEIYIFDYIDNWGRIEYYNPD